MITLQSDVPVRIGLGSDVEMILTNAGSWTVPRLEWIVGTNHLGTNVVEWGVTNASYWGEGAVVVVDQSGNVAVTRGADVFYAAFLGLVVAFMTVGLWLAARRVVYFALAGSGVPRSTGE